MWLVMPSQYRQILKVGLPQFYLLLMGLILHFFPDSEVSNYNTN